MLFSGISDLNSQINLIMFEFHSACLVVLNRLASTMICSGWSCQHLHNPTDTNLRASLDSPGLKHTALCSQNILMCTMCSFRASSRVSYLMVCLPRSGLGTVARKSRLWGLLLVPNSNPAHSAIADQGEGRDLNRMIWCLKKRNLPTWSVQSLLG